MIVVRADLLSSAVQNSAITHEITNLYTVVIAYVGGTSQYGHYSVRMREEDTDYWRVWHEPERTASIEGFRREQGAQKLVELALAALGKALPEDKE